MNSKNISSLFVSILIIIATTKFLVSYNDKKADYVPAFVSESRALEEMISQADKAYNNRDNVNALKLYLEVLKLRPYNVALLNKIGLIRLQFREYKLAEDIYLNLIKLTPDEDFFLVNLALSLFYQKKYLGAEKFLKKAIIMKSSDPRIFFIRAATLARQGDAKGALRELAKIKKSETIFGYLLAEVFDDIRDDDEFKIFLNQHKPKVKPEK